MPVIETNIAESGKLQKKKSLELAWDPLTGESLLDQVLVLVLLPSLSLVDQVFSVSQVSLRGEFDNIHRL